MLKETLIYSNQHQSLTLYMLMYKRFLALPLTGESFNQRFHKGSLSFFIENVLLFGHQIIRFDLRTGKLLFCILKTIRFDSIISFRLQIQFQRSISMPRFSISGTSSFSKIYSRAYFLFLVRAMPIICSPAR